MKIARSLMPGAVLAGMLVAVSLMTLPSATGQSPVKGSRNGGDNLWSGYVASPQQTLQSQAHDLAQQYVKSEKEDDKKDIRKKLTEVLDKQFDLHLQEQQKELDELEKQVAKLKAVLRKRKDAKENIVERRFEQLVQDADGLGWNAPSGRGNPYSAFDGRFYKSSSIPANVPPKK
jgi:hypothetical protein